MANRRTAVKRAHEQFVVSQFVAEINRRHRSAFSVVGEPDPPDAIIRSRKTTRWIEVTTAFFSEAHAKELYSHATPGEAPVVLTNGVHVGPDAAFANRFAAAVKAKLEKPSYEQLRDCYGPGYLVVSVQYPLFGRWTLEHMREEWARSRVADRGCFRSVYFLRRMYRGYKLERWRGTT